MLMEIVYQQWDGMSFAKSHGDALIDFCASVLRCFDRMMTTLKFEASSGDLTSQCSKELESYFNMIMDEDAAYRDFSLIIEEKGKSSQGGTYYLKSLGKEEKVSR